MLPTFAKLSPLALAATLGVSGSSSRGEAAPPSNCLIDTAYGQIQGIDQGGTCAFLGVPYAASPEGNNRWRPPQPAAAWAPLVLDATVAPTNCPSVQLPAGTPVGQENCLRLNIWVPNPAPTTPAAVIVWLHTGAFYAASANFPGTNGRRLALESGVIVVEPNYRLGPFGFLAHPALEAEDPAHPSAGNYGLLDQRAALAWVRDNIGQFGGAADNITLAGTSAGGQSVGLHLVSPGSDGLFQRAIIQSAYPTTGWTTRAEAFSQGSAFATSLGCTDPALVLACMRAATRDQVLTALTQGAQQIEAPASVVFWEPIVDGVIIPDQPRTLFSLGAFSSVPTLLGVTRDEGWGSFIRRSFPTGVSLAQYQQWALNEFGNLSPAILAAYPAASFASAEEALARLVGDGLFTCEVRRLADLIADGGLRGRGPHEIRGTGQRIKNDVFLYSYNYELDDLALDHVIHGVESNIIFGNNYQPPVFAVNHVLTAQDEALHFVMAHYWAEFARSGNPNVAGLPEWPIYRKNHEAHMVFDTAITTTENLGGGACDLWSGFFLRSMLGTLPAYD